MKLLEYEIVDHNQGKKVIARLWLDMSGEVGTDNNDFLKNLRNAEVDGYTIEHHPMSFLERLPKLFKGSYITARKVK